MGRHARKILILGVFAALAAAPGPTAGAPELYDGARELDIGGPAAYAIAFDLDGDGVTDVLRTAENGFGLTPLINRGDATFDARPTVIADHRVTQPPVVGDLDEDGDLDVVVGTYLRDEETREVVSKHLVVLTNDGAGGLTPATRPEACDPWFTISVLDLDGDGDREIAYGGPRAEGEPQRLHLLENDGTAGFSSAAPITLPDDSVEGLNGEAVFGDLGDGLPVLLVRLQHGGLNVLRNRGGLEFTEPVHLGTSSGNSAIGDVTGDGDPDIVTNYRGQIGVWRGTGDGWVLGHTSHGDGKSYAPSDTMTLCITDFDGDGDGDVVAESFPGVVSIYRSRGDGTFDPRFEIHLGAVEVGDMPWIGSGEFDADRGLDVFVHSPERVWILDTDVETPPAVIDVDPSESGGDEVRDFVLTGQGFTPETTVSFGEENPVTDLLFVSPERLVATVAVAPHGKDEHLPSFRYFDVFSWNRAGVSVRKFRGLTVHEYWDIDLRADRGRAKDSLKPGKDRLKVKCPVMGASMDNALREHYGEDVRLGVGVKGAMFEILIPADDPGWKVRTDHTGGAERMTWRSPKGSLPKVRLDLRDAGRFKFKLSMKGFDFPAPLNERIRVEFSFGEVRGAGLETWKDRGKGRFKK